MKDNSNGENSMFERYSKTTILFTVLVNIVVMDILLTNSYKYYQDKNKIVIRHPIYSHTFKKKSKMTAEWGNKKYIFFTNSLGFKDKTSREIDLKSTNNRILFIGDSFTEGSYGYDESFVGLIDSALSEKNIEVLNAGKSSYSPIIYWRKIKHLIEKVGLQFDEVVVYIDISDALDEVSNYDLSDDKILAVIHKPSLHGRSYLKHFIFNNTTIIYPTLNLLYDSFNLNKKEQTIIPELAKASKKAEAAGAWKERISTAFQTDKWTIDKNIYNTFGKDGVVLMKVYMNKLLYLLKDKNINLTIAVYPWPSQVWYEDLNSRQVNIWRKWAKNNNVKFINYFPDFVTKGLNNSEKLKILEKYYIPGDVHFNNEGHQVLANKFIKTYLKKE